MFNDTVAANLAYGDMAASSRGAVIEAAKAASAHEFILRMADGYDTLVGENGIRLSDGQRQRLVIAHRLSTIERADRILVVSEGRVVETDTRSELLAQDGVYARLQQGAVSITRDAAQPDEAG